jgi:hypothetical protein
MMLFVAAMVAIGLALAALYFGAMTDRSLK